MSLQWTSIKAYHTIWPTLGRRRRRALSALLEFLAVQNCYPTAQELERFAGADKPGQVWKRLPELRDQWSAIHNGPVRKCSITHMTVLTWVPGPPPGRKLGEVIYSTVEEIKPKVTALLKRLTKADRRPLLTTLITEISIRPEFNLKRHPPGTHTE